MSWCSQSTLRHAVASPVKIPESRYMFTVTLYVLEKDSDDEEIGPRFANVLVGLPHGLIHLTGEPRHGSDEVTGTCCVASRA